MKAACDVEFFPVFGVLIILSSILCFTIQIKCKSAESFVANPLVAQVLYFLQKCSNNCIRFVFTNLRSPALNVLSHSLDTIVVARVTELA